MLNRVLFWPFMTSNINTPPSIWALAWPITLSNVLLASIGLVQIIIAADFGTDATAAVSVSQRVFFVLQAALFGLSTGVSALVARSVGANELQKAGQTVQSAMLVGFAVSTLMGFACYIWAPNLASYFELTGETKQLATNLIRWVCIFNPIYALNIVLTSSMRGSGDAFHPLILAIISSIGNATGCVVFSHGLWGMPNLGVEGLAIGGIVGSVLSLVVYTIMWRLGRLKIPYPDMHALRLKTNRLLRVALPSAVEQTLMNVGFLVYMIAIATYGNDVLAAYGLGLNILTFIIFVSLGFSTAAAVIVGQYLGRGEPEMAKKFGWFGWRLCLTFLTAAGLVFYFLNHELAQLLTDDKNIQQYTALFFKFVAIAMPLIATDFALGGAIRGAGETKFPLKISIVSLLLVRFILPFVFLNFGLNIEWMFMLTAVDFGIKAIFMLWYFQAGTWQHKKI
jgi:putative MATE family efflux protein